MTSRAENTTSAAATSQPKYPAPNRRADEPETAGLRGSDPPGRGGTASRVLSDIEDARTVARAIGISRDRSAPMRQRGELRPTIPPWPGEENVPPAGIEPASRA